jgi:chemotaxis protein CheD
VRKFILSGQRCVRKREGVLSVLGLGSCVAIVLYDEDARVGGLAHVLLPDPAFSSNSHKRWRFATTAIPQLVKDVVGAGATRERITARIVGGACMFQDLMPNNGPHIGERNIMAARTALRQDGIRIVAEEVGGDFGRSIDFHLADGRVRVSSHGREDVGI